MSAVDDILFAPIGAAVSKPNWRNIPVHLTCITPNLLNSNQIHWQGGKPAPGIHYICPVLLTASDEAALRNEIYEILENCLNRDEPLAPWGHNAVIHTVPPLPEQYTGDMRLLLLKFGANPVDYTANLGDSLFGQIFADRNGFQAPILVDGHIDPAFIDLAVNPVVATP